MSNTLQGLNRKIASAGDLQGVVRSMKALAASSIDQYERAVESLDDYYRTVELALVACLRQAGNSSFVTEKRRRSTAVIAAVVLGSDQGLVGKFNEVLAEFTIRALRTLPSKVKKIWAVGERIHELIVDTDLTDTSVLSVPTSVAAVAPFISRLLVDIEKTCEKDGVEEVFVFHNHPMSGALYEPVSKRLLPVDRILQNKLATLPWPTKTPPEVIGDAAVQLQTFIRGYLFVLLFQACAESLASENASRLAAMQRAEKNIKDILEKLNGTYHRVRQESIDEELFEVVSGFEALTVHAGNTG